MNSDYNIEEDVSTEKESHQERFMLPPDVCLGWIRY